MASMSVQAQAWEQAKAEQAHLDICCDADCQSCFDIMCDRFDRDRDPHKYA